MAIKLVEMFLKLLTNFMGTCTFCEKYSVIFGSIPANKVLSAISNLANKVLYAGKFQHIRSYMSQYSGQ